MPAKASGDCEVVDACVEQLCLLGCRQVNRIIGELEQRQRVAGTEHLNAAQRRALLAELKSIMAVYSHCGAGE